MGSTVTQRDWLDDVRNAGVIAVANATGIMHPVRDDRPGSGWTPCPACGDDTRHHKRKDKRGAVGITPDGMGWRCFQCDASGDAVTLACYAAGQGAKLTRDNTKAVCETCERAGLIGPALSSNPRRAPSPVAAPSAPNYPPTAEVAALWTACRDVTRDTDAEIWLHKRKLDTARILDMDAVRVLPTDAELPAWARPWAKTGHRLIVPLYDAAGVMRSMRARAVIEAEHKSLPPTGFEIGGLVMADALALLLLGGASMGNDMSAAEYVRREGQAGVVIAEGEPDWLTWQAWYSDADENAPAVFGIGSGAWKQAHAARIPDGCAVTIATHADEQGDKYAEQIRATFTGRQVRLKRWKPKQ